MKPNEPEHPILGEARPSKEALTKTFATWEGLGPSQTKTFATWEGLGPCQVANVFDRATWPGRR